MPLFDPRMVQLAETDLNEKLAALGKFKHKVLTRYDNSGAPVYEEREDPLKATLRNGELLFLQILKGGHTILAFNLAPYPACCAMYQLNHFNTTYYLSEHELVAMVADMFFESFSMGYQKYYGSSSPIRRVLINFVESDGRYSKDPLEDLSKHVIREEDVAHPAFFKWAKSKKKFQTMSFRNHNSGNIIHCSEVVLL